MKRRQKQSPSLRRNPKKKNIIKISSKEQIREDNTLRIIVEILDRTEKSFDWDEFKITSGLNEKILELRAIVFAQYANFLLRNAKSYLNANSEIKPKKIQFVFGIIIALQKFIKSIANFSGISLRNANISQEFSSSLLTDLTGLLIRLKKVFNFNGMTVYNNCPQLLFFTDYDFAIPNKGFKPYPHQVELSTLVYESIRNDIPFVITLRTMTGTGKTTSVVPLAKIVQNTKLMMKSYEDKNLILLFCCNLRSVMDQASQWLFNSNIPFAIGSINGDYGLQVVNNYNCKTNDQRIAIICPPDACIELIMTADTNTHYVLFLDEPTIGADICSHAAKVNVKLMSILPKYSILSSATLPSECFSWIKENHMVRYTNPIFPDLYSNKIHIGCEIKTFNYELVVPHLNKTTCAELLSMINIIESQPFLGRAYTTNVVNSMYALLSTLNIPDLPDIQTMFMDIDNLGTDQVRELAMTLLKILAATSDENVKFVCATKIDCSQLKLYEKEPVKKNIVEEDEDVQFESIQSIHSAKSEPTEPTEPSKSTEPSEPSEPTMKVNFNKIGTSDAHHFLRQNLIATINPLKFTLESFKDLLENFNSRTSLDKLIQLSEQELNIWEKEVSKFDKREFKNQMDRSKAEEELQLNKPRIKFPAEFQVNTREHIKKYALNTKLAIDINAVRNQNDPSDIPYDKINVESNLIVLLLCGVGVYAPDVITDKLYNSTVLELAENGKLAYLISHSAISYGTNYPINRVFITDDFSRVYSTNTIFQLMSRAGRVGKSYIAEAYISDDCARKIINSSLIDDIETYNINKLYDIILTENVKLDQALLNNLLNVNVVESPKPMKIEIVHNFTSDKYKVEGKTTTATEVAKVKTTKIEPSLKEQFSRKSYTVAPKIEPVVQLTPTNSLTNSLTNTPTSTPKIEPKQNKINNFKRERTKVEPPLVSLVSLNTIIDAPPSGSSLETMFKRSSSNQQRRTGKNSQNKS